MKYIYIVLLIFIFSCGNIDKKRYLNTEFKFGTKLNLLDTLKKYQLNQNYIPRLESKSRLKIVTYIDGTCAQCIFELDNWNKLISNELPKSIEVNIYIHVMDIKSLDTALSKVNFPYPVIIDFKKTFLSINKVPDQKIQQTFLLNSDNEVLAIGNPLYHAELKTLYFKIIDKYIENGQLL